jgi:type VI secretion system protein ImpE
MLAEDYFREGNLPGALEALQAQVRSQPDDSRCRVFLFQLLAVLGQYSRARGQLDVLEKLDPGAWSLVGTYREAIRCEIERDEVFAGRRSPMIFGEPQQWIGLLLESLHLVSEGAYGAARTLRDQAFESAEESAGTIDQHNFDWIADADTRLGPVVEVILNGRYYWAPFSQVRSIEISAATDLRDLVWLPARFTWTNGGEAVGLIPTRYPGSENTEEFALQLARKTEWIELSDGIYQGLGQRMLVTDQAEYPLLDIRSLMIEKDHRRDE